MNRFCGFLLALCVCLFSSCSLSKNYEVTVTDGSAHITMHCPTIGLTGINQVSYDGFTYDEVEKELFDQIRDSDFNGNYTVWVTMQFKDSYGNYSDGPKVKVTTLSGSDVKKYASFRYFKGKSMMYKAFPWVHNYR